MVFVRFRKREKSFSKFQEVLLNPTGCRESNQEGHAKCCDSTIFYENHQQDRSWVQYCGSTTDGLVKNSQVYCCWRIHELLGCWQWRPAGKINLTESINSLVLANLTCYLIYKNYHRHSIDRNVCCHYYLSIKLFFLSVSVCIQMPQYSGNSFGKLARNSIQHGNVKLISHEYCGLNCIC